MAEQMIDKQCLQCNKIFAVRLTEHKRGGGKFCHRDCFAEYRSQSITSKCLMCEKIIKTKLCKIKNGRGKYCSRSCLGKSKFGKASPSYKHGMAKTPEHRAWTKLIARCSDKNDKSYKNYGGRGIKVCDEWQGPNGFINFFEDMGTRPSNKHSIDRIDVNGDYEPSNCRWATRTEQANNTRRNRFITFNGKTQTTAQWAKELGMSYDVIENRINRLGWDEQDALRIPVRFRGNRKSKVTN